MFLTANADTVYFWVNLDAAQGPIVVETPPLALGVIDDMSFQWVTWRPSEVEALAYNNRRRMRGPGQPGLARHRWPRQDHRATTKGAWRSMTVPNGHPNSLFKRPERSRLRIISAR